MIKYLILDVDGALTDGKVYIGNAGEVMKAFSVKDGYAINYILKPAEIESVIITGRTSRIVENRCKELGINYYYQGVIHKLPALKAHVGDHKLNECAYFGDDVLDLSCMLPIKEAGGIIGCPSDAVREVKSVADYICIHKAGDGAMREFSEWLVSSPGKNNNLDERIERAVQYITSLPTDNLEVGKYVIDEQFYYTVQEYQTKSVEQCKLESHRKYVDIQLVVEGEEAIDIADVSSLQLSESYSDEEDIMFWKPDQNLMRVALYHKSYVVLYPRNAHRGGISLDQSCRVKKIVGKIKI